MDAFIQQGVVIMFKLVHVVSAVQLLHLLPSVWSGVQVFNAIRDSLVKFPAIMSQSSQPNRYNTQNRVKKLSAWYVFMRVFPKAKLCFVLVTQNSFLNYKKLLKDMTSI